MQSRVPLLSRGVRGNPAATPTHPNFSHVLQDIGSVKLRSVPSIVRCVCVCSTRPLPCCLAYFNGMTDAQAIYIRGALLDSSCRHLHRQSFKSIYIQHYWNRTQCLLVLTVYLSWTSTEFLHYFRCPFYTSCQLVKVATI